MLCCYCVCALAEKQPAEKLEHSETRVNDFWPKTKISALQSRYKREKRKIGIDLVPARRAAGLPNASEPLRFYGTDAITVQRYSVGLRESSRWVGKRSD